MKTAAAVSVFGESFCAEPRRTANALAGLSRQVDKLRAGVLRATGYPKKKQRR